MPAELRRELSARVASDVAEPLAANVRAAARPPYATRVKVSVRKGVEPQLVAGGRARVFSGGAAGVQVFYGNEFGGGTRKRRYVGSSPRGHRYAISRRTARQFARPRPFVLNTFARRHDQVSDAWLGVLDPLLQAWSNGGE